MAPWTGDDSIAAKVSTYIVQDKHREMRLSIPRVGLEFTIAMFKLSKKACTSDRAASVIGSLSTKLKARLLSSYFVIITRVQERNPP